VNRDSSLVHCSKAFTPKAYYQGFTFPGSRGGLGFIDGTANLGSEDWPSAVLVGDNGKLRVTWPTGNSSIRDAQVLVEC